MSHCGHAGRGRGEELAPPRCQPRAAEPFPASVSETAKWTCELNPWPSTESCAQAQPDSAGEEGVVGSRKGAEVRASATVGEASSQSPALAGGPSPPPVRSLRVRAAMGSGRDHEWDRLVPQRPPRQQALTWPPSEPPSCGSETNACLRAAASPRPPRVRLGRGRGGGGGGGRGEARREVLLGRRGQRRGPSTVQAHALLCLDCSESPWFCCSKKAP
nr:ADP-ribosylation factor 1 isoform X2 [Camelus dromedarius]